MKDPYPYVSCQRASAPAKSSVQLSRSPFFAKYAVTGTGGSISDVVSARTRYLPALGLAKEMTYCCGSEQVEEPATSEGKNAALMHYIRGVGVEGLGFQVGTLM